MLHIEPVGPTDRRRALILLAGAAGRARRFEAMLSGPDAARCKFWWARTSGGPRATAMTVRSPGRVAMLFYGPRGSCRRRILARLLCGISNAALADDLAFVQAMLHPAARADVPALLEAGYNRLAELIYLRRQLRDPPVQPAAPLTWETFRPGEQDRLADAVEDSYVDSQDCPALRGLRRMEDVLAGHKATGIFDPKSWWIPTHLGEPVGCVLVNEAIDEADAAELVYLGVRPAYRRRGFARAMLRHALTDAARRGLKEVHLAVDAGNVPAIRLYRQEGFREADRREVYIKPADSSAAGR